MILSLTLLVALPAYLRPLPMACKEGAQSVSNGFVIEQLAECHPNAEKGNLQAWVQRVADAMGNAGFPPALRFGPMGPHLAAMGQGRMVSATFVRNAAGSFDMWFATQKMGKAGQAIPELPAGAELVADHTQAAQRLVTIHLNEDKLLDPTLQAIGAQALGRQDVEGAKGGRVLWQGQTGHYTFDKGYLNIYVGAAR